MPTPNEDISSLQIKLNEALALNQTAKTRLAKLLDQSHKSNSHPQPASNAKNTTHSPDLDDFNLHLDIQRLRKDYRRKRIILEHLQRGEDLAQQHGIYSYTVPKNRAGSSFEEIDAERSIAEGQERLDMLVERSRRLVGRLEGEVYKARMGVNRERERLEEVRGEWERGGKNVIAAEGRVRGLRAVRGELGGWIEGELGRCEDGEGDGDAQEVDGTDGALDGKSEGEMNTNMSKAEFEAAIDALQERYVLACKDIQAYSAALQDPIILPDADDGPPTHDKARPLPSNARHATYQHQQKDPQDARLTLAALEQTHLPQRTLESILQAHLSHLKSELNTHNANLSSSLQRLSHESHLLPAYPVLAHDERFKEARRVFGAQASSRGGIDSMSEGWEENAREKTDEEREVERLLASWGFAVESAEERTFEAVRGVVEGGEGALGRTDGERRLRGLLEGKVREVEVGIGGKG